MCLTISALLILSAVVAQADVSRIFREPRYDRGMLNQHICQPIDEATWLWHPALLTETPKAADIGAFFELKGAKSEMTDSRFVRFRCAFESDGEPFTLDVSADERFVIFLDGKRVARGPNRGWTENWQYQTYEVSVPAGGHLLEAVVTHLGESSAPITQMSYRGGFVVKASGGYDARLTTGKGPWQVGILRGTVMDSKFVGHGAMGTHMTSRGIGFEDEVPAEWSVPVMVARPIRYAPARFNWGLRRPGWMLYPSEIPDQLERRVPVEKAITVGANAKKRIIRDLGDYYCYYPELVVSGGRGSKIVMHYTEALVDADGRKGDRSVAEGKKLDEFYDMYDTVLADGRAGARFSTPWWRCGKWMVVDIETAAEPVTIDSLDLLETRYPLEAESGFESPELADCAAIQKICLRSLQNCAHEMLMDCPYYEQQMYPADTRVQMLTLTALSADDRLIRRCIEIYDLGRRDNGLVPNNWPTRNFQESSTMSLNYMMMYGDYVRWHRNDAWLKARLPGAMNTMFAFGREENADGLLEDTDGSLFIDWIQDWLEGQQGDSPMPVGHGEGASGIENLYYLHAIRSAEQLCRATGDEMLADYWKAKGAALAKTLVAKFWDEERGLMADDLRHTKFSEHGQCFAILADLLPRTSADRAFAHLTDGTKLARVTVYSLHYLFETFAKYGRGDLILSRLDLWRGYLRAGLNTCVETPVDFPSQRSDCHGWGSHPIYHLRASIAGIRPADFGFRKVRIAPNPGGLRKIKASMPHPSGRAIEVDLVFDGNGGVKGEVFSPVDGVFVWNGGELPLKAGDRRRRVLQLPLK